MSFKFLNCGRRALACPARTRPAQSPSANSSATRRKQGGNLHPEGIGQNDEFGVRNTSELRLDFGEGGTTQFKSKNGTTRRKKFLRQTFLIPQFPDLRTDNVLKLSLFFCHAPEMELDNKISECLDCSVFGAAFASGNWRVDLAIETENLLSQEVEN